MADVSAEGDATRNRHEPGFSANRPITPGEEVQISFSRRLMPNVEAQKDEHGNIVVVSPAEIKLHKRTPYSFESVP
jgi:hypothetical protein